MRVFVALAFVVLACTLPALAEKDPKACEVCIKVIDSIKKASSGMKELEKIESTLQRVCAGVKDAHDKKLCYYIEPIQREVSRPILNGLPADKICQRLKKSSSEICQVVYTHAAAPEVAADVDVTKLTTKELRQILAKRGVSCPGCLEKSDFAKRVLETKNVKPSEDL